MGDGRRAGRRARSFWRGHANRALRRRGDYRAHRASLTLVFFFCLPFLPYSALVQDEEAPGAVEYYQYAQHRPSIVSELRRGSSGPLIFAAIGNGIRMACTGHAAVWSLVM